MKKLILPVLAVFSLGTASAQFNLGVSVGYGFGSPGHVLGTNTNSTGSFSEKNIYGTLGTGLQANLTPAYMFGEHFGIELGLNGFFGSKVTIDEATTSAGNYKHTQGSSQFRISPALVVKSGGEKLSVYARGGFVLPLLGSVKSEINDAATTPGVTTIMELKTTGKVSLGYTGAVGLNVHFGEKMAFFAELGANSLRVKSKQTDLTKYTVNGTDQLGNVPTYGKQTKYVDELTGSSNNASVNPSGTNTGNAKEDLRQVANFSNFFIQVGIKFSFGK